MKKCYSLLLATVLTVMLFFPIIAMEVKAAPGDSPADPILITNLQELHNIRSKLNAHYALANDIDASETSTWNSGRGWIPIGIVASTTNPFTGSLNGNGFVISGLHIDRQGLNQDYIGLFGKTSSTATITDVGLVDTYITGRNYVGALVGYNDEGTVNGSYSTGSVGGAGSLGGLVGYNNGLINQSYSTADVAGSGNNVGGLVGQNLAAGTIVRSYATGDVSSTAGQFTGGLIGRNYGTVNQSYATGAVSGANVGTGESGGLIGENYGGNVFYSYATGDVDGFARCGGLIGNNRNHPSNQGIINQSYATGAVTGSTPVGGLVGSNSATIINSYATGDVAGTNTVGGLVGYNSGLVTNTYATGNLTFPLIGGVGGGLIGSTTNTVEYSYWDLETTGDHPSDNGLSKTTIQLLQASTYVTWDFDDVWWMVDGSTRPFLRMEWSTEIRNSHQLQLIAMDLSEDYTLMNDIDLLDVRKDSSMWPLNNSGSRGFVPIGNASDPFTGSFNGMDLAITGLFINRDSIDDVGLFGHTGVSEISMLSLVDVDITGKEDVGGLIGEGLSTVYKCHVTGNVTGTTKVGGLIGSNNGEIDQSSASVIALSSGDFVGGLVGNNGGDVGKSRSSGEVTSLSGYAGGLVGTNPGTVNRSYSTSEVNGDDYIGGLIGWNTGTVNQTYSAGQVTGNTDVGGLVGLDSGDVLDSYWDVDSSLQTASDGGTGKTTVQMRSQATFVGWDFSQTWTINEGVGYPLLNNGEVVGLKADAGIDRTVDEGTTVNFDGSASNDGTIIVNYSWSFIYDGGPVSLYGVSPSFQFNIPGNYAITLTVKDAEDDYDNDTMTVNVVDITDPVADAGSDQTVVEGTIVTLDGSASNDNVGIDNYTWTFNYDGILVTRYGVMTTFQFDIPGNYAVTLKVIDAAGNWDDDAMTVTIEDIDPVADAGPDRTIDEGVTLLFDGSGSYDALGITNYSWFFTYDFEIVTLYDASPSFQFNIAGVYAVTLNVTDAAGNWGEDSMTVTVNDASPPTAVAGPNQNTDQGGIVTFDASASTDNIGIVNYSWTFTYDGVVVTLYGETASYVFNIAGVYVIVLAVTDGADNTDDDQMTVTVDDTMAPAADAGPDQSINHGQVVTFNGSFSTDNVAVTNYTWTFNYDGDIVTLYGESPSYQFDIYGTYIVTLNVTDAVGNWNEDTMNVNVIIFFRIGPVSDGSGNPLSGANVTLVFGDQTFHGITDEGGNVTFNIPGEYIGESMVLTISSQGFASFSQTLLFEEDLADISLSASIDDSEDGFNWLLLIPVFILLILVAIIQIRRKA